MKSILKIIAFYLPQYHPIPENDEWWGKGFTEWTNVTKARPLFRGHYQPHLPADLGFYDLRLPEARQAQADLAKEYSIHGFCYYHYWFNGRRLLNRPFDEVLASGKPDFPFCLCWANEKWTRAWDGYSGIDLVVQHYSDVDDFAHIKWLAPVFSDPRYIRYDNKPLFLVYRSSKLPNPIKTTTVWRETALKLGIGELFLCRVESLPSERNIVPQVHGFDASVDFQPDWSNLGQPLKGSLFWRLLYGSGISKGVYAKNHVNYYENMINRMLSRPEPPYRRFPCVTPSWDNSPRKSENAVILRDSTPELYERWLQTMVSRLRVENKEKLIFLNAWNEWAEGNHLEPDMRWGRSYLEATRRAVLK